MGTQVVDVVVPAGYIRREELKKLFWGFNLSVSDATIDRMVADERLKSRLVPRPGVKPERVYLAEDVDRVLQQRKKRLALRPPSQVKAVAKRAIAPAQGGEVALAIAPNAVDVLRQIVVDITAAQNTPRPIGIRERLWLTVEEAVELSGLSDAFVGRLCAESQLVAVRCGVGGKWRILRESLETWRPQAKAARA